MKRPEDILGDQIRKLTQFVLSEVVKPDITVDKVSDLDIQEIERIKQEYGIEAIILDVDETLRTEMQSIPKINQDWIDSLQGKIKMIILSNGIDKSIEQYFTDRGIDYIGFACKPFKRNFIKACKRMNVKPENVMVVGDSLFDDVHGGKKNKMKTVLVRKVEKNERGRDD